MSCDVARIKLALNEFLIFSFLAWNSEELRILCVNNGTMGRNSLDDSILCQIKIQILIASIISFIVRTQFRCEFHRCWQSRYSRMEWRTFRITFYIFFSLFLFVLRPQQIHDNNEWAKKKKEKWGKWNEQSKSFHSHWTFILSLISNHNWKTLLIIIQHFCFWFRIISLNLVYLFPQAELAQRWGKGKWKQSLSWAREGKK